MGSKLIPWMALIKCKKSGPPLAFYFCRLEVVFLIFVMSWIIYPKYSALKLFNGIRNFERHGDMYNL